MFAIPPKYTRKHAATVRDFFLQGDVVYANFGRKEDFELLASLGVQVEGRIVLARYGEIFRANIVSLRQWVKKMVSMK